MASRSRIDGMNWALIASVPGLCIFCIFSFLPVFYKKQQFEHTNDIMKNLIILTKSNKKGTGKSVHMQSVVNTFDFRCL